MTEISRLSAEGRLREVFGFDHFYDEQWEAIARLLRGERILMIERTGFGKSLCYQFPAMLFEGITVVFSPLIALMRDQVNSLRQRGIAAAYINCEQSIDDNTQTLEAALRGEIKILYIAPERQESHVWIDATRCMHLSMIVIDEAHTISTWGHDFRPAFRRIIDLVQLLPATLPVLATTATATRRVQEDIERQIGGQLTTIRGSLVRENFSLQVIIVHSEDEKLLWLAEHIDSLPGTGLIYTGTRADTDIYARWLRFVGVNAIDYNAGLDAKTRQEIEHGLMDNKYKCVVSTNALGMGIDKPDIRFILHTQLPASPIHYFQEIGRAGRDGKPTRVILFYNETKEDNVAADYKLPLSFIESARPAAKKYQQVIALLREEPLTERQLIQKANLKTNQVRIIRSDLLDQGIVKEVLYGRTKTYEYQFDAKPLDTTQFELLREAKLRDLDAMVGYVYTTQPRMEYLCRFLDSDETIQFTNCDNTTIAKETVTAKEETISKLSAFRQAEFPELPLAKGTMARGTGWRVITHTPNVCTLLRDEIAVATMRRWSDIATFSDDDQTVIRALVEKHLSSGCRLTDGFAASYYGVSNVGRAIHRSKYECGGDFPDWLLTITLSLFGKKYQGIPFDLVLYVPPTHSGDLVRHFAERFAQVIGVTISHGLQKTRETAEQKIFQNAYNKRDNVADAFDIGEEEVSRKTILLIDDIYDSGATLREIGALLTKRGAKWIVPIVIAKTVGGTV